MLSSLIHYSIWKYLKTSFSFCFRTLERFEPYLLFFPGLSELIAQSAGAVEYTDCISAEGVKPSPNECPGYGTKQSDGEVPVMLELWGNRSTLSLASLQGPLWPGVVAPDRPLSMG